MIAPMKWEAYLRECESRYVIHVEVDAGPFVFHRYGIIDKASLYRNRESEVFKAAIEELTHEVVSTVHLIRGTKP